MTKLIKVGPTRGNPYSERDAWETVDKIGQAIGAFTLYLPKRLQQDFEAQLDRLARVVKQMGAQVARGEHQNPPAYSESGMLKEIGQLLRQIKTADDASHQIVKEIAFMVGLLASQARMGVHANPPSRAGRKFISQKIALLAHEGVPSPKRVAEAYAIARQRGFRGISLPRSSKSRRLRHNPAQLAVLGLNPPPRIDQSVDPIVALWGEFHYVRPDDPEGEVVRVHEFENGFVAVPLIDGRVLLESRRGERLWTAQ